MFRTLAYSQLWYILELKHIQNSAEYLRWNILLRTLWNYSDYFTYQLFFRIINLTLLLYPLLFIKSMTYSYTFFQPLLSIWALELLTTHSIVEIWQNFGYGLRVRRKEKYLSIRKCNNITNNSKKEILGNNGLFKVTSTENEIWLPN